jgi:nitrile hydratase
VDDSIARGTTANSRALERQAMTDESAPGDAAFPPGDHPVSRAAPEDRARALQSLLVEKELLSTDAVDEVVSIYEEEVGPMNGAEIVARAWTDPDYRQWLLEDGTAAIADMGYTGVQGTDIEVCENTPATHNVVVCTLCSCYPWPVLGLPPTWYKSPPYRSQMVKRPRDTLREGFDCHVPADVEIHVHDSSSEVRYMVLPQRPSGTDGMDADALADLVTRDSMIGVERLGETAAEALQ